MVPLPAQRHHRPAQHRGEFGQVGSRDRLWRKTYPSPEARGNGDVTGEPGVVAFHHALAGEDGQVDRPEIAGVAGVLPVPEQMPINDLGFHLIAERGRPVAAARSWGMVRGRDPVPGAGDAGDVGVMLRYAGVVKLVGGDPVPAHRVRGEARRHGIQYTPRGRVPFGGSR